MQAYKRHFNYKRIVHQESVDYTNTIIRWLILCVLTYWIAIFVGVSFI